MQHVNLAVQAVVSAGVDLDGARHAAPSAAGSARQRGQRCRKQEEVTYM